MAVAIPILIAATAAGATAAAAIGISAAALAIGTGLVLQVTGINDKINKAASKVFGEKLVSVANIAGSIFLGAQAAGLLAGAGEAAGALAGAAGAAEGGAQAAANAAWSAGGAAEVAGGAGVSGLAGVDAAQTVANATFGSGGAAEVAGGLKAPAEFQGALAQAKNGATKVGEGLKTAWNSMGDKTQSTLMQVGGQMLSGASAGKAAEEAEKARIANENRYRSGSGLTYWQNKPSYTPPGA